MSIRASGLTRVFPDGGGVRSVDLEAEAGRILVLFGPSGCGKTTLLRLLAGLEVPESGRIEIQGRDVTRLAPENRGLGYVFQNYALFPHLDVGANVAFGLRMQKKRKDEIRSRVRTALALVDLDGSESRSPAELSGGEQQRVALARALVTEPKALLLDEPFSNLDGARRRALRGHLRKIQAGTDIALVHVTHDREEALALADRLSVLDRGRIVQTGPPREVYECPRSAFVARFLAGANVVEAERAPSGGALLFGVEHPMPPGAWKQPGRLLLAFPAEAVLPDPDGGILAEVLEREYLGADVEFTLGLGDVRLRSRVPSGSGRDAAPGTHLRCRIDASRLCVLERDEAPA